MHCPEDPYPFWRPEFPRCQIWNSLPLELRRPDTELGKFINSVIKSYVVFVKCFIDLMLLAFIGGQFVCQMLRSAHFTHAIWPLSQPLHFSSMDTNIVIVPDAEG